jgi:Protein of unknown function (DUF2950)
MKNHRRDFVSPMVAGLAILVLTELGACAKKADHTSFAAPDESATALIAAARSGDQATLRKLFGPGSEEILSSGDEVADKTARENFIAMYDANHALVPEGEDKVWLQVGADGWPMPVPIVKRDGRWYLDGAEGADEVVYRRVGRNELGAIAVCRGYVDAQIEYAAVDRDGEGAGIYANKLVSDPGTHNGLYWEVAEGEPPSPVGPAIAAAAAEGYRAGATAYHGYRYRQLFRQSDNANGGAKEYFENGVLKNGFALVAWPAEYGVSGVMTFIVNQDGVVFQKDLGENTQHLVAAMDAYDPDSTWTAVVDSGDDAAT